MVRGTDTRISRRKRQSKKSPRFVSSVASLEEVNSTGQPLQKKLYAIYMSICQLVFYLSDTDVTIKCDHLPLKKFLTKQTLNSKVNNWAVELEQFNLKLDWIMGVKKHPSRHVK